MGELVSKQKQKQKKTQEIRARNDKWNSIKLKVSAHQRKQLSE
jgi:hypothetical protein